MSEDAEVLYAIWNTKEHSYGASLFTTKEDAAPNANAWDVIVELRPTGRVWDRESGSKKEDAGT